MAALECSSIERKDFGEKNATKLALSCKKNGVSNGCYCEEKMETRNKCRSHLLDKILRLNGSVKSNNNNCFPRPTVTTLRSRRERDSAGAEPVKRRRRSSRHDPGDTRISEPPDADTLMPVTPDTPDSLEVASITRNCCPTATRPVCNSGSHIKDIAELFPLVTKTNGIVPVQVTPDPSRSSTPISLVAPSPSCSSLGSPTGKGDATPTKETDGPIECQWKDCGNMFGGGEIMEHIRSCHVIAQKGREKFMCLWKGCKVYNKPSSSKCWLDRHILTHSGDKPFRCIVDRCGQRFTTQGGFERHVNSHFNAQEQSPNHKNPKHGREDTPTKLFKRKRLKTKRRAVKVKTDDYIDTGTMERLQHQLNVIAQRTEIDLNNSNISVTFHSSVIARRKEGSGKVQFLLHWTPEDILPDEWVSETQVQILQSRVIPVHHLPPDTVTSLHPSIYRQQRYRKHRRK
ncbi:zinc finger protein aebp2-like [Mya arenaria]|uniref:zinc finger protein aebp2-like n=1 Tax=Mya arenaria TaxID=6604 RepID=UPI0022E3E939|nr:zinc finger protein aebp2-like [Mya arenaria]